MKARSALDLTDRLVLDTGLVWVGEIEGPPSVASHAALDARLGYEASEKVTLFIAGRNLLDDQHMETADPQRGQLVERQFHAGARMRF